MVIVLLVASFFGTRAVTHSANRKQEATGVRPNTVFINLAIWFVPLIIFSLVPICMMSFIGIATYVYIDEFGMSEQAFNFIFAANAAFAILGPFLYLRLSIVIPVRNIILG